MSQALDDNRFPDQTDEFRVQQAQLARRRQLAQSLIEKGMEGNSGSGYQGGKVYIVGNPLGNIAQSVAGNYMQNQADTEQTDLAARQQAQTNEMLSSIPASGPERVQAQIRAMQNPSLRDVIKAQMGVDEHEAARLEKSEQEAANRVEKAEEAERDRNHRQARGDRAGGDERDGRPAGGVPRHAGDLAAAADRACRAAARRAAGARLVAGDALARGAGRGLKPRRAEPGSQLMEMKRWAFVQKWNSSYHVDFNIIEVPNGGA